MFARGAEVALPVGTAAFTVEGKPTKIPFDQIGQIAAAGNEGVLVRASGQLYLLEVTQLALLPDIHAPDASASS